jgi:hypothetical protein
LSFLKPAKNANKEISVRDYMRNCDSRILFISCFNDATFAKLSEIIIDSISFANVLKIFSSKAAISKSKNTIVDALCSNAFNVNDTIISSKIEIQKRDELKKLFPDFLTNQTEEKSFFIKTHTIDKIICGN